MGGRDHQTRFSRSLLGHCLRWRAARDHGDPRARSHPMLPSWQDGVFPGLQDTAVRAVAEDQVALHSHAAALNSSMVFGLNLFLPFRDAPEALSAWASELWQEPVTVDAVRFEWVPPGHLLGELRGDRPEPGEPATGIDVALWSHTMRRSQLLLVEVKLSEGGFTHCGGRKSRANRTPEVCASAERFFADPGACYLRRPWRAERDRRYWEVFSRAHGGVREAFPGLPVAGPCPFAGDGQQPMRQLALALALEQAGVVDQARLVLVHHDDNPDVPGPWDALGEHHAAPERLSRRPATSVVGHGPPAWRTWMRTRYRLPEAS